MEKILQDKKLYEWLQRVDVDVGEKAGEEGCEACGAKVHRGDYPRKPRGGLKEAVERWGKRLSWCCSREGCRKRKTPPSVRFLGRKVYVGVLVVLVAAMRHGLSEKRVVRLREALGLDRRTLSRWQQWWTETFAQSAFWRGARGQFRHPIASGRLPLALVEAFGASAVPGKAQASAERREGVVKLMRFLSPITTGSCREVAAM